MRSKLSLAVGALALVGAATANAADFSPVLAGPPPGPAPTTVYAPTFGWGGLYVGAYGGYTFGGTWISAGAQAGYNFVRGGLLAGVELQAGAAIAGGVAFEGWANARLGAILGSNVLVYGEAGLGMLGLGGTFLWSAGGGIEIALGQSISVFAEGKALGDFGGCCAIVAQGGINWRPGY